MISRTNVETWILRNLRERGPRLLGARRESFEDSRGRARPYLDLGTDVEGTLVFIHGFSDRPEHFLGTAALLRDRYRILIPSVPAFGDGFREPGAVHDFDAFGSWMEEMIGSIAPRRFHLMGNSLGGAASLAIASRLPLRIESLTLVDTAGVKPRGVSCVFDDYGEGPNPFEVRTREDYDAFAARISSRPNPALELFSNALFEEARSNADWYVQIGRDLGHDVRAFHDREQEAFVDLGAIAVPTLVVWGSEDTLFPPAVGEHIARALPNARLELLHGVGHCPHLESPRRLAASFDRFAREVRRGSFTPESTPSRGDSPAPRA